MLTRRLQTCAFAVALLAVASLLAAAQGQTAPETRPLDAKHGLEAIPSEADHEAAAQRFEAEAVAFEKQATAHEQMSAQYHQSRSNPHAYYESLADHCDRLIKNLKAAAAEAHEMARLHREVLKLDAK
jgi:hypothetical protein